MFQIVLNDTIAENVPIQQLLVEMRIQGTYVLTSVHYSYDIKCKTSCYFTNFKLYVYIEKKK